MVNHAPSNGISRARLYKQAQADSPSCNQWRDEKARFAAGNTEIDQLMEMVGLEAVKKQVLSIKSKIELCKQQNTDLKEERLGMVFLGNPGTGDVACYEPSYVC